MVDIENKENKEDKGGSIRLSTMLPFEVFSDFVKFCKENTKTGLNKWDYGSGIRILLMKAKEAENLERMSILEDRIENVENILKVIDNINKLSREVING